jgi:hypothetical protein
MLGIMTNKNMNLICKTGTKEKRKFKRHKLLHLPEHFGGEGRFSTQKVLKK